MQANWASAAASKLVSFTGMSTILKQLIPAFEPASGRKITNGYDASNIILDRIENGESANLINLTAPVADTLAKAGKVVAGSCTDNAGPLAGELQMFTMFSTGLMAGAREVDACEGLSGLAHGARRGARLSGWGDESSTVL